MAQGPAEYVVRLGTSIDNNGLNQIINFFDTFRKSGLGIAAAVTGATTALYKFIESTTKQEFELRKLAKAQGKSVEEMTKQDAVLKAMGKSLDEVRKDDKLKKTYEEIMKFNKELELPSASGSLKKIEELRAGFWKLKSIVGIAVSSIGKQLLINLEEPIKRITGGMDKVSDWVRTQLNSISSKVSSVLTAFAKGIMGIGSVFSKIFSWIQSLPAGIKAIAVAIGALGLALSTGPIGQVLLAISAIGDLIHDYDNYKWNQQNAKDTKFWAADNEKGWTANKNEALKDANGNEIAYKVPLFLEPAWEGYEQDGIMGIGKALGKKITEGLGSIDAVGAGESLGDFIVNLLDQLTATVSGEGADTAVGSITTAAVTFGQKLLGFIGGLFSKIAPTGAEIGGFINGLFAGIGKFLSGGAGGAFTLPAEAFKAVSDVANGILDFIVGGLDALLEEDPETHMTGAETFISGIFDFIKKAIEDFATKMDKNEIDVSGTISGIGEKIGSIIGSAIKFSSDILRTLIGNLMEWVSDPNFVGDLAKIGKAILDGIISGMGNIFDAIMSALFPKGWNDVKEKSALSQYVESTADENEQVTWADGSKHSVAETHQLISEAKDAHTAAKVIGQEQYSAFDVYRRSLFESLGFGGLTLRGDFTTVESGGTQNYMDAIARRYGMKYMDGRLMGGESWKLEGEDGDFSRIAQKMVTATDESSLLAAVEEMNSFMQEHELAAPVEISGAKEAAEKAKKEIKEVFSDPVDVKLSLTGGNSGNGPTEQLQALGGRFGKRTNVTLGEDGTEYIIPITKPARAAALLKQMFGEMGGAAVGRITKDLGLGIPGTNGAGGGSMSSALSGMQMANTYTINAPVTINVQSSGADAREIGARVYDLAERNLIKNLVGVNG